jgi:hypothetical protein
VKKLMMILGTLQHSIAMIIDLFLRELHVVEFKNTGIRRVLNQSQEKERKEGENRGWAWLQLRQLVVVGFQAICRQMRAPVHINAAQIYVMVCLDVRNSPWRTKNPKFAQKIR